jgi:membrane protease YdiL (CAAX protease family)
MSDELVRRGDATHTDTHATHDDPGRPPGEPVPTARAGRQEPSSPALILEALFLFGVVPLLFLFSLPRGVMPAVMLLALAYVVVQGTRHKLIPRRSFGLNGFRRFAPMLLLFALFAVASTVAVAVFEPESLFSVVRTDVGLWLLMLVIYCCFSVYPQALVFRGFFIERYGSLFRNERALVLVNAAAFAWAHNIIAHPLVYALTFCGGVLFCRTWLKSRSVLAVSIEHALYGFWLFTVGLGGYFAFPGG